MWDVTKSMLRLPWAMSIFGVQQVANLLAPPKTAKALENLIGAAEAELSSLLNTVAGRRPDSRRSTVTPTPVAQRQAIADLGQLPRRDGANTPGQQGGWGPMPGANVDPGSAPARSITGSAVSPEFPYEPHYVEVFGSRMHYIEQGAGDPILLLHGNPTWSYIWRNIIPHLSPLGRCIAPDLVGYGRSDKPNIEYSWFDHVRYLEKFIDVMGLKNIALVLHDHGSSLGFHYATRHQRNVRGIAFFEAIVKPFPWDTFSTPEFRDIFRRFRAGGVGDEGWRMLVDQNMFIEQLLPLAAARPLSEKEMNYYREPFRNPASRAPIWRAARDTPIGGEPPDVWDAVTAYSEKLQRSELPKLLLFAKPGALLTSEHVEWCNRNIKNLKSAYIGPGAHFVQESSPHQIGQEVAAWLRNLPVSWRQ